MKITLFLFVFVLTMFVREALAAGAAERCYFASNKVPPSALRNPDGSVISCDDGRPANSSPPCGWVHSGTCVSKEGGTLSPPPSKKK